MSHVKPLSRMPRVAQQGVTTPLESVILFVLSIFFGDWANGPTVIGNLADFYAKTPEGA